MLEGAIAGCGATYFGDMTKKAAAWELQLELQIDGVRSQRRAGERWRYKSLCASTTKR
jgi:hypothetical protein